MYEINRDQAFVTSFGPFSDLSCKIVHWPRISGLPIRAKYKHFRTIWEHAFDNSPTDFNSSSLKWWSSRHGSGYFVELLRRFVRQLTMSFHTFLGMTFHVIGPRKRYSDVPSMVIFQLLLLKFWIQAWFKNCQQYLCLFHIVFWVHPRYTWSRNDVGSPKINFFV